MRCLVDIYLLQSATFEQPFLLTFSDVAARAVSQTDPVPIGVITALLGAPFFAFLLKSKGLGNG